MAKRQNNNTNTATAAQTGLNLREQAIVYSYFNDLLRSARAAAYQDAEGFQEVLFVIEKLGSWLTNKVGTMNDYAPSLRILAAGSALAEAIPAACPNYHIPFAELYESVRIGRNDALHQGAVARHLTTHAVQLALILEDALKIDLNQVRHYMVQDPVRAELWQPISIIRQQMLENSYTHLPVLLVVDGKPVWHLVSDHWVAQYLGTDQRIRGQRLATSLEEALDSGIDKLHEAGICHADTPVADALQKMQGKPLLVVDQSYPQRLLGIITPYDVL